MDNREINETEKQKIIEDMIVVWVDEGRDSLDYILECASAIGDDNLFDLVEKAMGLLEEFESIKDEIDDIMSGYEELEEEN